MQITLKQRSLIAKSIDSITDACNSTYQSCYTLSNNNNIYNNQLEGLRQSCNSLVIKLKVNDEQGNRPAK